MGVEYLNPDGLHQNPAFTNIVVVTESAKTIYIGGQNSVNASGEIVGHGDLKVQAIQAFENLQTALNAVGASLEHIIKWNVYVVQGQPLHPGFEAFQEVWGNRPNPPAITMMVVAGLANPDFLIELDAVAVVPE